MDSDGLPIVGSGVDYSKVDPLNQKRTLTFLNHFLIRTTSFLNHFSSVCDEKLENLLIRIQRLEASMCILEAKLASIPGLDDVTANVESIESSTTQNETGTTESPAAQPQSETAKVNVSTPVEVQPKEQKPKMTVSQDPRFAKYFKMVNIGVEPGAVRLKMTAEGVDPSILNNPDAEAPPGAPVSSLSEDESEESAESDFSD